MRQKYDSVDLLKWICSWLEVYIHTYPVLTATPLLDTFIANGIARLAVPFFFAVSMFLLFQKLDNHAVGKIDRIKTLVHFSKRILGMYLIWSIVYYCYYIFYRLYNGISYQYTPFGVVLDFFARGVQYHLWYLIATVYALPIVYLLWKTGRTALVTVCVALHILQCLNVPYHFAPIFSHPAVTFFIDEYDVLSRTILHAIPLMCLGVLCRSDIDKHSHKEWGRLLIVSFFVFASELIILLIVKGNTLKMERSLTSIFLIYTLTNWLFTGDFHFRKKQVGKALRISSIWIYCIHPLFKLLYHWIFAYEGIVRFAVVCFMTLVSAVIITTAKLWLDRRLPKVRKINQLP